MIQSGLFTRSVKSKCTHTDAVLRVSQMFGIGVDEEHEVSLYKDLRLTYGVGRIVYITGESGAGKSSLLRDIIAAAKAKGFEVVGELRIQERPLVDLFRPFDRAVTMLTMAGLSEPFVMVRTPSQLSDGQRYRLNLALHMDHAEEQKKPSLVVMDEFLANLDRETARCVAYQTRKVASMGKIGFVVATTHTDIEEDLQADLKVELRLMRPPKKEVRIA